MAKHYDKQFKLDAVQYYHDHKNLGLQGCATNLGISQQTLSRWQKELRETGDIESRGSGNYASDEANVYPGDIEPSARGFRATLTDE